MEIKRAPPSQGRKGASAVPPWLTDWMLEARSWKLDAVCPLGALTGEPETLYHRNPASSIQLQASNSPATFGSAHIGWGLSPGDPRSLATAMGPAIAMPPCLLLRFNVFQYRP